MTILSAIIGPLFKLISQIIGPLAGLLLGCKLGKDAVRQADLEVALRVAQAEQKAAAGAPTTMESTLDLLKEGKLPS